jgi:hypothetical protein
VERVIIALHIAEESHDSDRENNKDEVDSLSVSGVLGLVFDADIKLWARTVKRANAFALAISYVALGASFRQASRLSDAMKQSLGVGTLGSMLESFVQVSIRLAVCFNLEQIELLLCHRA